VLANRSYTFLIVNKKANLGFKAEWFFNIKTFESLFSLDVKSINIGYEINIFLVKWKNCVKKLCSGSRTGTLPPSFLRTSKLPRALLLLKKVVG
jgi:hypothetical protein